jgi:predicted TPR repeat methyltransferase
VADANFAQARDFFLQGVQHTEAGRLLDAERCFEAALSLVPGRPSTLANLAVVKMRLGRADQALPLLEEALEQEPDDVSTLGMRALALAELGHRPAALAAFDAVLAKTPHNGAMWMQRGTLLVEMKRPADAEASYRKALAHGADEELTRYYLAAVAASQADAPPTAPRDYVEGLFDKYADDFDVNLVQELKYQAPTVLAKRLAAMDRRFAKVLDLGCGTGLCGRIAKSFMLDIEGVDISSRMLEKAAESGAYGRLVHADVLEFLREARGPYDLVISADVFIYVGAIDEVFRHVARCLAPGGIFCFSVEDAGDAGPLVLKPSRRYAHSDAHVRELAAANALALVDMQRAPIREDGGAPIPGLYFWLAR